MSIFSYIKHHAVIASVSGCLIIVVAVIAGRAATSSTPADVVPLGTSVSVVSAASFRNGSSFVSVQGVVESHAQADLKSQVAAPISIINSAVGDTIYTGQIIAELQNADIRAQLESARASLTLAQGQYGSSRQGAIDKIRDAYINADSILHIKTDPLILNQNVDKPPVFEFITSQDFRIGGNIRIVRTGLNATFDAWKKSIDGISASSSDEQIHQTILLSQSTLETIGSLLNDISIVFNDAALSANAEDRVVINEYLTVVSASRTAVSVTGTALTSAEASLGSPSTQGSAAEAGVSIAEANVRALEAQLAKTVIRSPITGKISALPLHVGEFAAPGQLIATVVGSGGLQVQAFASGEDVSRIIVGAAVTIEGRVKGTVSGISPSVNATNKKAEVNITILNSDQSGLVVGDNVQAMIEAKRAVQAASSGNPGGVQPYIVPIQNVKIIPGAAFVFTVDEQSKIKRNDVILGQVRGDFVEVISGMTDDMSIVSPVYELEEGQVVTVL